MYSVGQTIFVLNYVNGMYQLETHEILRVVSNEHTRYENGEVVDERLSSELYTDKYDRAIFIESDEIDTFVFPTLEAAEAKLAQTNLELLESFRAQVAQSTKYLEELEAKLST